MERGEKVLVVFMVVLAPLLMLALHVLVAHGPLPWQLRLLAVSWVPLVATMLAWTRMDNMPWQVPLVVAVLSALAAWWLWDSLNPPHSPPPSVLPYSVRCNPAGEVFCF